MKAYFIYTLILLGLLLVGCAENPALIGLKEEVPKSTEGNESESEAGDSQMVSGPPRVSVSADDVSADVARDVWCWKEESLCSLEPNPPAEQLYGYHSLSVKAGDVFSIVISTDGIPATDHIYYPDIIEATQIRLDEEKKVEVNNKQITAPTEKGKYYYSLKLQWDGELVGQAYYVFSISVQ
ncbi:hypothetical protein [Ornithinibacillus californiensis]|uniref:hypothetical protein n=1 Tax=Ornithinibacillus californiensis TaxID=161536 RepID=UPI00064E117E|nr:hypothetical protein [Ornithinibacillus californiensis]